MYWETPPPFNDAVAGFLEGPAAASGQQAKTLDSFRHQSVQNYPASGTSQRPGAV